MTAIIVITISILLLSIIIVITKTASKKKHTEKNIDNQEEYKDSETIECPVCHGSGGHYINTKDNNDAEFVICKECDGDGEISNRRFREQKLDDCKNEAKQWIDCKNCDACGYIYTEKDQMVACPICDGYGIVEDTRTAEEKEADKIAAEKHALQEKLDYFLEDNEIDFYGDKKRNLEIKHLEARLNHIHSELNSINDFIKNLKETTKENTQKTSSKLNKISKAIWELTIIVFILCFFQCSNTDKICDKISDLRDDISAIK